jgi:mono/diheme cytochrome c family protein
MLRALVSALIVVAVAAAALWLLTAPRVIAATDLPMHTPDPANGEVMFWAGGCASCHAVANATGEERLRLGGGQALATPFGRFHVPNISPDGTSGIGRWSLADFVTAMKRGVAPGGVHLYPAFPYPSYQRMTYGDIIDLKAYLDMLPPVARANQPHELAFPYNIRRGVGLWQFLNIDGRDFAPDPAAPPAVNRGAYLVQGAAHCGECHTPRTATQAMDLDRWLSGARMLDATNDIAPNLTPHATGLADWFEDEIVRLLQLGVTPTFDSVGGAMGPVVASMGMLPQAELEAIAAYLKSLPPLPASARRPGPAPPS